MATNDHESKGRRVTDQHGGLLDAAQQAVRLERIEGEHRLLAKEVQRGLEGNKSSLDNVQIEVRTLVTKVSELARLQSAHDSNKEAISEIRANLTGLNQQLERWFSEFDQRQSQRWRDYEANRDAWRKEHTEANDEVEARLSERVDSVRDKIIWASGVSALGGVLVMGFLWVVNGRFNDQKAEVQDNKAEIKSNRERIDAIRLQYGDKLHEIELYLARGGSVPEERYEPSKPQAPTTTGEKK